ncbi:MAG: hypothetical protein ABSG15_04005 [FCB group bacterium]|jgi:hypothetical protein
MGSDKKSKYQAKIGLTLLDTSAIKGMVSCYNVILFPQKNGIAVRTGF